MPNLFVRQIGEQSGIQLNPTLDRTDGVAGFGDQTAAIVGSFSRGRIDRHFGLMPKHCAPAWVCRCH